jgi:hypothetical protein
VNYYFNNQWIHGGPPIDLDHPRYKPLGSILVETFARYGRPIMIAETGIEDERRASWFEYVSTEAARAAERGVPLEGLCLYPIVNHAGWDDDRVCDNGLLSSDVSAAGRRVYEPLASAIDAAGRRKRDPIAF